MQSKIWKHGVLAWLEKHPEANACPSAIFFRTYCHLHLNDENQMNPRSRTHVDTYVMMSRRWNQNINEICIAIMSWSSWVQNTVTNSIETPLSVGGSWNIAPCHSERHAMSGFIGGGTWYFRGLMRHLLWFPLAKNATFFFFPDGLQPHSLVKLWDVKM